ncbi:hypothetical protein TorRG33x02_290700 [Trema orientale]|uniref:Transmembrane protein n=1 Tax=Trema orientale TaxID=63057 RepID=A0A2P5CC62_TREOI|nr:hypothetical protein TorRG33x02_290700 [Trema orientale]
MEVSNVECGGLALELDEAIVLLRFWGCAYGLFGGEIFLFFGGILVGLPSSKMTKCFSHETIESIASSTNDISSSTGIGR